MESSTSRRANLEEVERQTGKRPPDLDGPEPPDILFYLWGWFCALHGQRGSNGFGPSAISFSEIAAWSQLTDTPLQPFDVETLIALDRCYLESYAKTQQHK